MVIDSEFYSGYGKTIITPESILSNCAFFKPISIFSTGHTKEVFLNDPLYISLLMSIPEDYLDRHSKISNWHLIMKKVNVARLPLLLAGLSGKMSDSLFEFECDSSKFINSEGKIDEWLLKIHILRKGLGNSGVNFTNEELSKFIEACAYIEYYKTKENDTQTNSIEEVELFLISINKQRQFGIKLFNLICKKDFVTSFSSEGYSINKIEVDGLIGIFHSAVTNLSNTTGWMCYCLSLTKKEELKKISQDDSLLSLVIDECLRLYPPVWIIKRKAVQNFVINNVKFEPGNIIYFSPLILHRTERYWSNANDYIPYRFQNNELSESWIYLPFGRRHSRCPATAISLIFIKQIIENILMHYEINNSDNKITFRNGMSLSPFPLSNLSFYEKN